MRPTSPRSCSTTPSPLRCSCEDCTIGWDSLCVYSKRQQRRCIIASAPLFPGPPPKGHTARGAADCVCGLLPSSPSSRACGAPTRVCVLRQPPPLVGAAAPLLRLSCVLRHLPAHQLGTISARPRFHRQRDASIGCGRTAWVKTSATDDEDTSLVTCDSGKLWCGPRAMVTASSSAAAWSSKSNVTQKRFRSARPKARLIRPPKGAWTTSWVDSTSSKKRSTTMRFVVGRWPSARSAASR